MKDLVKENLAAQNKELQKNGTMPAANGTIPTAADGVKFQISAPKIDLRAMPSPIAKALLFGDTAIVAKGELATIVALPSSGKSNICEALVAAYAAAKGYTPLDTLGFLVPKEAISLQKKLLWVDTERTTNDVLFGVQRLLKRSNPCGVRRGSFSRKFACQSCEYQ